MKHSDTKLLLLCLLEVATILEAAVWDLTIMFALILMPLVLFTAMYSATLRKQLSKHDNKATCKLVQ